ncbi:uncharacterized protein LOC134813644 [Bolinopsis microptera]|uniref:uncharacterized protein LOC134813644 n=1 Tax=Bolinopsis microptera TaxID=2820187 RepID=UPI00307B0197
MKAPTNTQADHLSEDDTARLLSVLGTSDPEQLLASLIFYTTYTFALRGGTELNNMTPASFTFTIGDRTVDTTYVENAAKNRQPGLKNIHHKRRTVTHISKKSDTETFYFYYHFYLDRCPPEMRNSSTLRLFQHPLRRADPSTDLVWYGTKKPLGRNY